MERGEVWWAALPSPTASEPGYRRPVLVVQLDDFNRSRISTVIALAITSNLQLAGAPGNVRLSRKDSGLPKRSVGNVSQLITLDKCFLTKRAGKLNSRKMAEVEAGIRLVLSL